MKRTLFASLVSGLCRVISTNYYKLFHDTKVDSAWYQEIQTKEIETPNPEPVVALEPELSQEAKDWKYFLDINGKGIIVIGKDRFGNLLKYIGSGAPTTDDLKKLNIGKNLIVVDDCLNIGIING